MGGSIPLGYDIVDKKLIPNETEAKKVQLIFKRFTELGSAKHLMIELAEKGYKTKKEF